MNLKGERIIPASVERTWIALNDPQILKAFEAFKKGDVTFRQEFTSKTWASGATPRGPAISGRSAWPPRYGPMSAKP